jgi:hypothetical protein
MEIVYQLAGAGWADARITDGVNFRNMSVSYLSDALGDMAKAALNILRGENEASFAFEDEPGEHLWLLTREANHSLRIKILWCDDTFGSERQKHRSEVFATECTVLDFVSQVSAILDHILTDEGIEGYKQRWTNHDFPIEIFNELQRLLALQSK